MTSDIEVAWDRSSKAKIDGTTDSGIEFVDGYMPSEGAEIEVVDSGRIILSSDGVDKFMESAMQQGLTVKQMVGM